MCIYPLMCIPNWNGVDICTDRLISGWRRSGRSYIVSSLLVRYKLLLSFTITLVLFYSYTCDCPAGYTGVDCSEEIDECLLYSPCQNGATCSHGNVEIE